ncbi:DUF58 domain-containing protein [Microbacterium sp. YY-01]|uniref:DUF58 domain-containing protein n=1 Tax=Microbacterium sp. YY-01 TaxID=3421634 RepID=UPI003D184F8A
MAIRSVSATATAHFRPSVAWMVAVVTVVAMTVLGLLFSRPDAIVLGIPSALWAVAASSRFRRDEQVETTIHTSPESETVLVSRVHVATTSQWVQLSIDEAGRRTALVDAVWGSEKESPRVRGLLRLIHSGPLQAMKVQARLIDSDGAAASAVLPPVELVWNAAPPSTVIDTVPVGARLTGLHGNHRGARAGDGGLFRDIHPFAPGDELRRIDWRATARLARRADDLFVRRTDTLSDASVVIVVDTAEDLGAVVTTWGTADTERSGVTSLDLARQTARFLAESVVGQGDRVAVHALEPGGVSVREGSGLRHQARVIAAIAGMSVSTQTAMYRRTPPVAPRATIFVLSTFFDGAAAALSQRWRAAGHRVIAMDTLPVLDETRLSPQQQIALRIVQAERTEILQDLAYTGIDVVRCDSEEFLWRMREVTRSRREQR